jgi:hypothetical protein
VNIVEMARAAIADPDIDPANGITCRVCRSSMTIPSDLEPSPLCDTCAHEASRELAEHVLFIYDTLGNLPLVVSAPIFEALKSGSLRAHDFIKDVLATTAQHVLGAPPRRARVKRRR